MALRDIRNFKFLNEAIVQKFRNPDLKIFRGIPFEPQTNPQSVFGRIYTTFRELIPKGLNLHQYLNISDRRVLENLYRNLQNDINLKFLNNPNSVLGDSRFNLSDNYYQSQSKELTEAQQAGQIPVSVTSTSTASIPFTPVTPRIKPVFQTQPADETPAETQDKTEVLKASQDAFKNEPDYPLDLTQKPPEPSTSPAVTKIDHLTQSISSNPGLKFQPGFARSLKGFGSSAGRLFQRNIGRLLTPMRIATAASTVIGAVTGGALTSGSIGGMLGGAGAGALLPHWIRNGDGARFFRNAGNRAINSMANLSNQASGGATRFRRGSKRIIWILAGLFISFSIIGTFFGSLTETPTGEAAPITPPIIASDISSCEFTRGDRNPKEASFKSPLLLSYIQEASGLTKIPTAVLAAFIRVESPSTVYFTDEQIKGYQCIETDPGKNVSVTGALGIMQLQPEGTEGNDRPALAAGAKLIGKEYSQLTKADYCDVRKSIIMGAGFILTKMSYKGMKTSPPLPAGIYPVYGDGTQWNSSWTNDNQAISKLVNGYYGCLQYPSCINGPYNYATDVSTSIQSCQTRSGNLPPSIAIDCPIPNGVISCGSQATPINGCGHCGIGYPEESTRLYCGYPGTKYAIDIEGDDFQPILLPKIGGEIINWTYLDEEAGSTEAIQKYTGISTGYALQIYYLQLHHTQPGSGNPGTHQSGAIGGKICGGGCNEKHTHIQIGSGGDNPGGTGWLDAAQYFCRK